MYPASRGRARRSRRELSYGIYVTIVAPLASLSRLAREFLEHVRALLLRRFELFLRGFGGGRRGFCGLALVHAFLLRLSLFPPSARRPPPPPPPPPSKTIWATSPTRAPFPFPRPPFPSPGTTVGSSASARTRASTPPNRTSRRPCRACASSRGTGSVLPSGTAYRRRRPRWSTGQTPARHPPTAKGRRISCMARRHHCADPPKPSPPPISASLPPPVPPS